jgi:Right handed beta helix region
MRRREFSTLLAGLTTSATTWPSPVQAQQKAKAAPQGGNGQLPPSSPGLPGIGRLLTSDLNLSGRSGLTVSGVTFNGCRINLANATNCNVYGCTFNNQPSRGLEGSAVNLSGANGVRIWNCDFIGVQGNGIGQYAPNNISVRGCQFSNCYGPFSYTVGESNVSRGLVIQSCIFTGFVRTGIEIAPDAGPGTLINLLIDSNWFDDVDPGAGSAPYGTGPISVVVRNQTNTRITDNFLRKGNRYNPPSGYYGGIEVNSSTNIPVITGNLLEDFNPAAYTLWEKATSCPGGNRLFNASGPLPNDTVLSSRPADPSKPGRVPYP